MPSSGASPSRITVRLGRSATSSPAPGDHEARITATALGRGVLVEGRGELRVVQSLQVAVEAHPWRVEVEEAQVVRPVVAECVHDIRGYEDERPRAERALAALERERERSFEDVEAVGVQVVDVQLGPALAGSVARLGDDELLACDVDVNRSLRRVGDEDRLHDSSL